MCNVEAIPTKRTHMFISRDSGIFWSQYQAIKNRPNVYELYSVLVHEGGTHGGHYYAYIKVQTLAKVRSHVRKEITIASNAVLSYAQMAQVQ